MARCKSQLVITLLETGSESTAQQQLQEQQHQQQQQFETEENGMVVEAGRYMVELETGEEEPEELLQLPTKQQQQLQSGGTTPCLEVTARNPII